MCSQHAFSNLTVMRSVPGEVLETPIVLRSTSSSETVCSQSSFPVPFQPSRGSSSRSSVEEEAEEAWEAPPEFVVGLLPEEDARVDLGSRKSAPEFCRGFAMSAKLTDFAVVDVRVPDRWLWTRM